MKSISPRLVFFLLASVAYTLGTTVYLRSVRTADPGQLDQGVFKKLLGDGRRLFAGQFVEMADVYFHGGFYPSIFDRRATQATKAVTEAVASDSHSDHDEHADHEDHSNCDHETHDNDSEHVKSMTPEAAQNWLESFIRRFRVTEHTHLAEGQEREILPWLKMAIELDPQGIETYTTAAYWLREMGNVDQAQKVLREGLQNNPGNYELLFEMGRLYKEDRQDLGHARNLWLYAGKCWRNQSPEAQEGTRRDYSRILSYLGELEIEAGNTNEAIDFFEQALPYSPRPDGIQSRIDALHGKVGAPADFPPTFPGPPG